MKQPKKAPKGEMDDEDKAFQEKQKAGKLQQSGFLQIDTDKYAQMRRLRLSWLLRPREAKDLSTPVPRALRKAARNEQASLCTYGI